MSLMPATTCAIKGAWEPSKPSGDTRPGRGISDGAKPTLLGEWMSNLLTFVSGTISLILDMTDRLAYLILFLAALSIVAMIVLAGVSVVPSQPFESVN